MAAPIAIREEMEKRGYNVRYDPTTKVITLHDPATGRTGTIAPTAYELRDGRAFINPEWVGSWLSKPVASGTATAIPQTAQTAPTQAASTPQQGQRTAPQQTQRAVPQDVLAQLGQQMQQYLYPYEKLMRDILAQMPRYQQPSPEELRQQAQLWAKLEVDPALQAISQTLAQTKQALQTQQERTEAAYAGLGEATQRLMQEAAQRALESAIARGGGRSGQVEWYTSRLQQPIAEQYTQAQAQKTAALSDIAGRMALAEQQAAQQQQALEQRRGELEAARLSELQNLSHATATGDWQRAFQAAQNLASMAAQAQQFGMSYAASLLPFYAMTEYERQTLPLTWTQATGEVPAQAPMPANAVPLRLYAGQKGASIDYDPDTDTVIINGRRYSAEALEAMGGRRVQGSWYLPESAISTLIGGK